MDLQLIKELRKNLKVAHHIPGRIRIRFDLALMDHPRSGELLDQKNEIPGIKGYRINIGARSIVIEYDTERIRPELLQEFFTTEDRNRVQVIVSELVESIEAKA